MTLDTLYAVLHDSTKIEVWSFDYSSFGDEDFVIFSGMVKDSLSAISQYMNCEVLEIEVDDFGVMSIGIAIDDIDELE